MILQTGFRTDIPGFYLIAFRKKPGLFFVYLMICNDDKMVTWLSVLP